MKKTYQSEILEVLHGMAEDLHEIGAIGDAKMAEYDRDCLVQKTSRPAKARNNGRQPVTPVFAGHKK
jgi:DNA-binding transcriptional regulator YiaG